MIKKTILILFLLGISIAAGLWYFKEQKKELQISFETETVKRGYISITVTATGTVQPIDQVEVGTQVSGVIQKIYVDYNSRVKKGQLLAELDKSTLQARLIQAKASVASAENELDYQQRNFKRIEQLGSSKAVSQTDYENAFYQLNNAKVAVDKTRADLKMAEINLNYAAIESPIDGVILDRSVEQGQTVAASFNTPTLFTIANDLTKMQVEANVDEADIGKVKEGQRVTFVVDAFPDDEFIGTVSQIRLKPKITSNVVTYTVIIEAPNPKLKLMPGLTANITIYSQEVSDVLLLSVKALRFKPDRELLENRIVEGKESSFHRDRQFGDFNKRGPWGADDSDHSEKSDKNHSWGTDDKEKPGKSDKNDPWGTDDKEKPGKSDKNDPWGADDKEKPGKSDKNDPWGVDDKEKQPEKRKNASKNITTVWVKNGEFIQPKRIKTGLNDGTIVEVVEGIEEGDMVVLSATSKSVTKKVKTSGTESASPFMPRPPRGRGRP